MPARILLAVYCGLLAKTGPAVVDGGVCQMMDVFSPPRLNLSKILGFVLDAAEYPMPVTGEG